MSGIHHVTAISGNAGRNLNFYTRTLGLRFVKKTVNFDDPATYHLYYGDEVGHPGTILTFFPWEDAAPGRAGISLARQTSFRVPMSSIGFWTHSFLAKGVTHEPLEKRFDEPVLSFTDPDGLSLALVGVSDAEAERASSGASPKAYSTRRMFAGALSNFQISSQRRVRPTASLLRSRSAIRTAQTLRRRYCCCGRMCWRERSCYGPWCRSPTSRKPI